MDLPATLALAADGATAASAAFNAVELDARRRYAVRPRRRVAAAVLQGLSCGIAVQAAYAMALFAAHDADLGLALLFAPPAWLASRAPLLAGTLALTALLLRSRR